MKSTILNLFIILALVGCGSSPWATSEDASRGSREKNDQVITGQLMPTDLVRTEGQYVDEHIVQLPANQNIRVELNSEHFDTYLIVQPPQASELHNDDIGLGNLNSALDFTTHAAGTHRILVSSYEPRTTGDYTLVVHDVQQVQGANPTALPVGAATNAGEPQRHAGQLDSTDPRRGEMYADSYQITLPAGQPTSLRLNSSDFDPILSVVSPSGHVFENDDVGNGDLNSRVDIPAAEAGSYQVIVSSYHPNATGHYELVVGRDVTGNSNIAALPTGQGSGNVYGVFVGIADYPGEGGDLDRTDHDARRLANVMVQHGYSAPSNSVLLIDGQATVANVTSAVQRMANVVGPNDTFIFFYSGHGGQVPATDNTELDGVDETLALYDGAIRDQELARLFDGINAKVAMLALDSCYAGGFAKDVINRPNRIGFFSSEEDMTSAVPSDLNAGGYLAHFLADGIEGQADTLPRDGVLTTGELTHYLTLRFGSDGRDIQVSNGYQHLVIERGTVGNQVELWRRS